MSGAAQPGSAEKPQATSLPERIAHAVAHAAHYLPDQGPIGVFVHHNTLHAFQHLPFHRAVAKASELFGTEPYLSERAFREAYRRGRIEPEDLDAVLGAAPPGPIAPGVDPGELRRLAMLVDLVAPSAEDVRFRLEEGLLVAELPEGVGDDAARRILQLGGGDLEVALGDLWGRAEALVRALPAPTWGARVHAESARGAAHGREATIRDRVLGRTGEDIFDHVIPTIIYATQAYLDEGMASWAMPDRSAGFLASFSGLWREVGAGPSTWFARAAEDFKRHLDAPSSEARALALLADAFDGWRIAESDLDDYVLRLLRTIPGWAGMVSRLERHPEDRLPQSPPASLLEWFAVFVVLLRSAADDALARRGAAVAASERDDAVHGASDAASLLARTYTLWRVAVHFGMGHRDLDAWRPEDAGGVLAALDAFPALERRRLWHEAYERQHRRTVLRALAAHRATALARAAAAAGTPTCQVVFCLDEREESFRRAVEELRPDYETFGAAGFFGLAMNFQGLDDVRATPHCPVGVIPPHTVAEVPRAEATEHHQRRRATQRRFAAVAASSSKGSRGLVRGAITSFVLGIGSGITLLLRVLLPRATARALSTARSRLLPRPSSSFTLLREDHGAPSEPSTLLAARESAVPTLGYTAAEAAERVHGLLATIGLTKGFSPLVVLMAHGSSSLNNPHESAYDCGACSGKHGAPNARAFAALANDPRVREALATRGLPFGDATWFVGAEHDTCSDGVEFFDTDLIPDSHRAAFKDLEAVLDRARAMNAEERCRRFENVPDDATPGECLAHVEARAVHIAEPRPEYGHSSNAVCIVARRALTRGLFLDRRAFLFSYDPHTDDGGAILGRILSAVGPVCSGISLEYYFSRVDNERYGCGTKLPHNITGLLGVMNGPASDLRTGLNWQMVEIHDPVRLLLVVEARPEVLLRIAEAQPVIGELLHNRWVQFVAMDPDTGALHEHTEAGFVPWEGDAHELPVVEASKEWFVGHRDHLAPAVIRRALRVPDAPPRSQVQHAP